eukprot:1157283-Pelagomonas_calceolata.AAC.3
MAALGDKVRLRGDVVGSTILAQAAGVPTLPWSGSGVAISFEECEGDIPPELYAKVGSVTQGVRGHCMPKGGVCAVGCVLV